MQTSLGQDTLSRGLAVATGADHPTGRRLPDTPEVHRALVSLVEERWKAGYDKAWQRRREAAANVNFFIGRQWDHWDDTTRRFVENAPRPKNARYFPRLTVNYFQAIARAAISRFLSSHPVISITAASSDQIPIDAARVAQRVIGEYEWKRQDMDSVLATLVPHVILKGGGFLKTVWDPTAGDVTEEGQVPVWRLDENDEPVPTGELDEKGQPLFEIEVDELGRPVYREERLGANVTRVVSIDNLIFDETVTDFSDSMYCIEESWLSPAYIQNRYPGKYVQPKQRNSDKWQKESYGSGAAQVLEMWTTAVNLGTGEDGEEWSAPNGYMVVVCDGKVLEHGPNINADGKLPYRHIRASVVPDSPHGDTFMNAVRSVQHALNLCVSHVGLSTFLASHPVWITHHKNEIKQVSLTSTPGSVIEATWGTGGIPAPQRIDGASVAGSALGFLNFLLQMMQDVSGQHEGGMMGGNAPGVEAAIHAEAINERDLSKLGATAAEIGRGIEWWARVSCKNWQKHSPQKRTLAVAGATSGAEVIEFGGVDIHESFDISVVPETVLPQGRAARFQKNLMLLSNQLISRRDFLKRVGDESNEEMSLAQLHANKARDENRMMRQGGIEYTEQYLERMKFDDPETHFEEHLRMLLDPSVPDATKEQVQEHLMLHDLIARAAAKQMAEQAQLQTLNQPPPESAEPEQPEQAEAEPAPAEEPAAEEFSGQP